VHGHLLWKPVSAPLMIAATRGAQNRRLSGSAALVSGSYRLTLTPEHGTARSISFRVG
jgi:hypothetical protein